MVASERKILTKHENQKLCIHPCLAQLKQLRQTGAQPDKAIFFDYLIELYVHKQKQIQYTFNSQTSTHSVATCPFNKKRSWPGQALAENENQSLHV